MNYKTESELTPYDRVRVETLKYIISESAKKLLFALSAKDYYGAELEAQELAQSLARLDERLSKGVFSEQKS